jgi:hypothetical protein
VDFPAWSARFASALILPARTLASTKTSPGDRFTFCDLETMKALRKRLSTSVGIQSGFKALERENSPSATSTALDEEPLDEEPQEFGDDDEDTNDEPYPSHLVLFAKDATPIAVEHASQFTFVMWPIWQISNPTVATRGFGHIASSATISESDLATHQINEPATEPNIEPSADVAQQSAGEAVAAEAVSIESAIPETARETEMPSSPPRMKPGAFREPEVLESPAPQDPDEPRFYFPKRIRFFDPIAETSEDKLPSNGDSGARQSTQLTPALQAVILQLTEQQKQRENAKFGKRSKPEAPSPEPEKATSQLPESMEASTSAEPLAAHVPEFRPWFDADEPVGPADRRVSSRLRSPGLVAYYFSGGPPRPQPVADISATGFYLQTNDHWVPHTLVRMTLQGPEQGRNGKPSLTIAILARVVRIDPKGVGHEYVLTESLSRNGRDILPDKGTDKQALEEFLELLRNDTAASPAH